jgi:uncharacterized protein YgbK (DUF1537 family)
VTGRIGVLADDLTGAGDAALAFARAGFSAEIAAWPARRPAGRPRVWVLDTASRSLPGPEARRRVRAATRRLKGWKAGFIYKKIDSTLRGPVGPELDGFLDALGPDAGAIHFVPAFPAAGRTTRGGRHFVDGVPLHRTAFGKDPTHPLSTDRLADILGPRRAGRVELPDVPDQAALRRSAKEVLRGASGAAAGSAGFAAALAKLLGAPGRPKRTGPKRRASPAPVMLLSGSAHERSRRQAEKARVLFRKPEAGVLLVAPSRRGKPAAVLKDLTARALSVWRRSGIRRVAVTGGATASALARAVGVARWTVAGEVALGTPLLVSVGKGPRSWWVIKPGGFGQEDVWTRAIRRLSRT